MRNTVSNKSFKVRWIVLSGLAGIAATTLMGGVSASADAPTSSSVYTILAPPSDGNVPDCDPADATAPCVTASWRAPENALDPDQNQSTQEIDQATNLWAQKYDTGDEDGVAQLFTDDASIELYSVTQTNYNLAAGATGPSYWAQAPTGYSPSATPTGGTAGGGCTVTGRGEILGFLEGNSVTGDVEPWADTAAVHTLDMDTMVKFDYPKTGEAYSRTYIVRGPWSGGSGTAQVYNTWAYSAANGWQISDMHMLYQAAQPDLPCQNHTDEKLTPTAAPAVKGTARVGSTLTATAGTWPTGTSVSYQWTRDGKAIAGATGAHYQIAASDAGKNVAVTVTATLAGYSNATAASHAVKVAAYAPVHH